MKEFSESGGVYGGDERFSKNQSRSNSSASATTTSQPNTPVVTATKKPPAPPPQAAVKTKAVSAEEVVASSNRKSVKEMIQATKAAKISNEKTAVKPKKIAVTEPCPTCEDETTAPVNVEKKPELVKTTTTTTTTTTTASVEDDKKKEDDKELDDKATELPSNDAAPKRLSVAERIKLDKQKSKTRKKSRFGGASLKCGACNKTIYPNDDKISMGDKVYHKKCAKCETCNGQLTISNFATSGLRLLCKTHFMKEFSESGGVYGGDERFSKNQSRSNSNASTAE